MIILSLTGCAHKTDLSDAKDAATPGAEENDASFPMNPGEILVWIYQNPLDHLNAVRRPSCPMYPSCSEYGRMCFREKGFIMGWFMTFDRLMRCGRDELDIAPKIYVNGEFKAYDPPPFLLNKDEEQ